MSAKAQLLSTMAIVAVVGIAVIVIGVSEGGGLGTWIAVLGVLGVMLAGVGAIETMRWLRPSTRLPEHLRLLREDPAAERMAVEALDSLEDAATAYAYLVGFLIEDLADARRTSVAMAIAGVRARLRGEPT
jgi:hypothetical protein